MSDQRKKPEVLGDLKPGDSCWIKSSDLSVDKEKQVWLDPEAKFSLVNYSGFDVHVSVIGQGDNVQGYELDLRDSHFYQPAEFDPNRFTSAAEIRHAQPHAEASEPQQAAE